MSGEDKIFALKIKTKHKKDKIESYKNKSYEDIAKFFKIDTLGGSSASISAPSDEEVTFSHLR